MHLRTLRSIQSRIFLYLLHLLHIFNAQLSRYLEPSSLSKDKRYYIHPWSAGVSSAVARQDVEVT